MCACMLITARVQYVFPVSRLFSFWDRRYCMPHWYTSTCMSSGNSRFLCTSRRIDFLICTILCVWPFLLRFKFTLRSLDAVSKRKQALCRVRWRLLEAVERAHCDRPKAHVRPSRYRYIWDRLKLCLYTYGWKATSTGNSYNGNWEKSVLRALNLCDRVRVCYVVPRRQRCSPELSGYSNTKMQN